MGARSEADGLPAGERDGGRGVRRQRHLDAQVAVVVESPGAPACRRSGCERRRGVGEPAARAGLDEDVVVAGVVGVGAQAGDGACGATRRRRRRRSG